MASNASTTAVLDAAMKVIATEPVYENFVAESELADLFETNSDIKYDTTTGGRYIERSHWVSLPGGFGGRLEDDNLPEADDPVFVNSRVYLPQLYGRIELQGFVFDRVVGDAGSFLNYAEEAFPKFAKGAAHVADGYMIGYGFGIVARMSGTPVNVSAGVYDLTLVSNYGVSGYTGAWRQLKEGDRLVFSAATTFATPRTSGGVQSCKVISLNEALDVARVSMTAGLAGQVANADYIAHGDEGGSDGVQSGTRNRVPQGLIAGVDDGNILATYTNVSRTGTAARPFTGIVIDSSDAGLGFSSNLTEDLLVYADERVTESTGEKIDTILLSYNGNRMYWKDIKKDRMLIDPRLLLGGKMNPMPFLLNGREINLRVVRKIPNECVFGLTTKNWKKHTLGTWQWDDKTGAIWNRVVTSTGVKDRFYAIGKMSFELTCGYPRGNFRIDNLQIVA